MANFFIYLTFLLYLIPAGYVVWRRRSLGLDAYWIYLILLVPAFLLVLSGYALGTRIIPDHQLIIHGYRTELQGTDRHFRIGSDSGFDDVLFHYRFKGRERIEPGILEISFPPLPAGDMLVRQTNPFANNVISINGLPLRAQEIKPGRTYAINFGAFDYSSDPDQVLNLAIEGGVPVFRFRGKTFADGFSRRLFGGLISIPYSEGQSRHLSVRGRIRFDGTRFSALELLGQASVIKHRGAWYLAANDADILLDGIPFPVTSVASRGDWITLATRELGEGRQTVSFQVFPPDEVSDLASVQLAENDRKITPLPADMAATRLCLTAEESFYSGARDIIDAQFPKSGTLIHREAGQFLFRGNFLDQGDLYQCGKAVFSIDRTDREGLMALSLFALLFLAAAFFVPPGVIRGQPLIAVLLSAMVFLLAFRQLLAFRAWQGPPYKFSILTDSLTAPYLCLLLVLVLTVRYRPHTGLRYLVLRVRNFFAFRNEIIRAKPEGLSDGLALLALAAYGVLLWLFFKDVSFLGAGGPLFLALIAGGLVLSLGINLLEKGEAWLDYLSSARGGIIRWRPALLLLLGLIPLILAAPMLGGREVIAILPGRPRPDIFSQLILLFLTAYLASVWVKEAGRAIPNPLFILLTLGIAVFGPFWQGFAARDMGFFFMVTPPLLLVLSRATWDLDHRVRALLLLAAGLAAISPLLLRAGIIPLDEVSLRRIAFLADKERIRAEYFFDYLAHLPILWVSNQGFFGGGFFAGDWYSALSETSVNDNVASVFIQGELGGLGSAMTMGIFLLMAGSGILMVAKHKHRDGGFKLWFLFGICISLIWTAGAMFLANLGYFPLTGKNLPLLGIDSLNDVVRYGLLIGFAVRYMGMLEES